MPCQLKGKSLSNYRSVADRQLYIQCDRGGKTESVSSGIRTSSTRKIECPFSLYASKKKDDIWYLTVKNSSHNHEAISPSGHSIHRRPSEEIRSKVETMGKANIKPRQILSALELEDQNVILVKQDINNILSKARIASLNGQTPMESLFYDLQSSSFPYEFDLDEENHVKRLFMVHPEAVSLIKRWPFVIMMDNTYKTNKFNMPLFHIIGMSSSGNHLQQVWRL
jgi:alpha-glucosidase